MASTSHPGTDETDDDEHTNEASDTGDGSGGEGSRRGYKGKAIGMGEYSSASKYAGEGEYKEKDENGGGDDDSSSIAEEHNRDIRDSNHLVDNFAPSCAKQALHHYDGIVDGFIHRLEKNWQATQAVRVLLIINCLYWLLTICFQKGLLDGLL